MGCDFFKDIQVFFITITYIFVQMISVLKKYETRSLIEYKDVFLPV